MTARHLLAVALLTSVSAFSFAAAPSSASATPSKATASTAGTAAKSAQKKHHVKKTASATPAETSTPAKK
jgi:hypothetical protein